MPDMAFSVLDPKGDVEDRREEFSPWQHLLMSLGVPPMDNTENAKNGIPPGDYDTGLDIYDPLPKASALGLAAGSNDLDRELGYKKLANRLVLRSVFGDK